MIMDAFQTYKFLLLLGSTLVSTIIADELEERDEEKAKVDFDFLYGRTNLKRLILWIQRTLTSYLVVTAVVSIFYAICRSSVTGTTIIVVWMGIISYVQGFYPEYCLCPIIVGVLLWYLKEKEHKKLNWLAITVFFGMLISTAYLGIKTPEGIVVKDEILTQLKYVPMPYEPRLVDIAHFRNMCDSGYQVTKDRPEENNSSDSSSGSETEESTYNDNAVSLRDYINNVKYFMDRNDLDHLRQELTQAYEVYLSGDRDDRNAVGSMWFYKGRYEDVKYYRNAGRVFQDNAEYYNAIISFNALFRATNDAEDGEYVLASCEDAVRANTRTSYAISIFKDVIVSLYNENSLELSYVENMCTLLPSDAFINSIILNHQYSEGAISKEGVERLEKLIDIDEYSRCPKLLILESLLKIRAGEKASVGVLYKLYITNSELFEQEDRVNLAWLLYEMGEYVKAYEVAARERLSSLCAEAYLQNQEGFPEMDSSRLYEDMITDESNSQSDRALLVKSILRNELGIRDSYEGLSDVCRRLFGEGDTAALFIVASLDHSDGNYEECLKYCNMMLEKVDEPDNLFDRVIFLKADALIGVAQSTKDEKLRQDCYEEAEAILNIVKDKVTNDYVACLERLSELYRAMGTREQELHEINDLLIELR